MIVIFNCPMATYASRDLQLPCLPRTDCHVCCCSCWKSSPSKSHACFSSSLV